MTNRDWQVIWQHLDRMQQRVMSDIITEQEFFAEPPAARLEYYDWMQIQCGEYASYM